MSAILKERIQNGCIKDHSIREGVCGEHLLNPRTTIRPRWYSTLASVLFFGQGGRTSELSRRLNLITTVFSFQAALEAWVIFKRQAFDRWGVTIEQRGTGAGQHSRWTVMGLGSGSSLNLKVHRLIFCAGDQGLAGVWCEPLLLEALEQSGLSKWEQAVTARAAADGRHGVLNLDASVFSMGVVPWKLL